MQMCISTNSTAVLDNIKRLEYLRKNLCLRDKIYCLHKVAYLAGLHSCVQLQRQTEVMHVELAVVATCHLVRYTDLYGLHKTCNEPNDFQC